MGLLGCGGRGTTHAETIIKNTDARLIALADMFQDRLDSAKQHINELSAAKGQAGVDQTFVGPHAYQQIIESKDVDAVVIATPPYFHVSTWRPRWPRVSTSIVKSRSLSTFPARSACSK